MEVSSYEYINDYQILINNDLIVDWELFDKYISTEIRMPVRSYYILPANFTKEEKEERKKEFLKYFEIFLPCFLKKSQEEIEAEYVETVKHYKKYLAAKS